MSLGPIHPGILPKIRIKGKQEKKQCNVTTQNSVVPMIILLHPWLQPWPMENGISSLVVLIEIGR